MRRSERPLLQLPKSLLVGFLLLLAMQLAQHQLSLRYSELDYRPLTMPMSTATYRGLSLGSPQLLSYLLSIRLQLHDNQAGRHIPYSRIDYALLVNWLDNIYQLNTQSEYPVMLATRVYSQTRDKAKLRLMLEFVQKSFQLQPQKRWRHLAEATVIAKHQLGDIKLALAMAAQLENQPDTIEIPRWARDLRFLLLGDLNEFESAIAIISALLQSNAIGDDDEKRFLQEKLSYFQQKLFESQQNQPVKGD